MNNIKKTDREFDLVIYGATGFTGGLAVNYVAKQYQGNKSIKWCVAGRSRDKLEKLAAANGNPSIYVAEADNEAALNLMCARTKAVAACAGPFSRYGKKLVAACVNQGTDYCDITGEIDFVREMIALHDDKARETGARIVHLCGHDSIPWDISTLMLSKKLKEKGGNDTSLDRVDFFTHIKSAPSGGTLETAFDIMFGSKKEIHPSVKALGFDPLLKTAGSSQKSIHQTQAANIKVLSPGCGKLSSNPKLQKRQTRTLFFMAGVNANAVKRSNALNGYGDGLVYCEGQAWSSMFGAVKYLIGLMLFGLAIVIPPIRAFLRAYVLPAPGQGPSEESMSKGFLVVTGVGENKAKNMSVTSVMTFPVDPGYKDTARMVVEATLTLALDSDKIENKQGGVFTPACCQGAALLDRLCDTGTTFECS